MYTIYKIINKNNDKVYIGRTKQLKRRMIEHRSQYKTPAFPKLLYVLEEDNITPDSKYWYLTELAAKCTAKRMVPDYISEKIMKENKEGNVFPCINKTCA